MLIIGQDKDIVVNFDNIVSLWINNPLEDNESDFVINAKNNDVCEVIGSYETEEKAKEVLKEIIEKINNQKYLLKPKVNLPQKTIENAKKYFEKLNNVDLIVDDENFEIIPVGDNATIIYYMPPKKEVEK